MKRSVLALLSFSPALFSNNPQEMCCPEINDCCVCNVCPPTCVITPHAGPCVEQGANIYVTADFLYWQAREDNLAISVSSSYSQANGVSGSPIIPPTPAFPEKGKAKYPDFKWRPGFKVGLGYDFCHDGWDLFAEYTWLRSNDNQGSQHLLSTFTSGSLATLSQRLLDPYWLENQSIIGVAVTGTTDFIPTDTSAKWQLHLNVVDLELGRNFYVSPRLMLRPYVGLKGTWDKQKWIFSEFDNNPASANPGTPMERALTEKMSIWGIGPRIGLDTAWHICRSFSFLGDIAVTALWEHFSVDAFATGFNSSSPLHLIPDSAIIFNFERSFFTLNPVLEMMLGLRYETWFTCNTYHFAVDAGWEFQVWLDQNQFSRRVSLEATGGNLILQGLTLRFRLDF